MPRKKKEPVQAVIEPVVETQVKKRRKLSHVLTLNDDYYITCNDITYILKKRSDGLDKNGKKKQDDSVAFATDLQDILESATRRMIRIPTDFNEIIKQINHVYGLIDARIPPNCRPKDLFTDLGGEEIEN